MQTYLLRVGDSFQTSRSFDSPPLVFRIIGPNGYGVAVGPAVRVVCAVGVERVLDRDIPDFTVGRYAGVRMLQPVALAAVCPVEPASAAAVRPSVWHGAQPAPLRVFADDEGEACKSPLLILRVYPVSTGNRALAIPAPCLRVPTPPGCPIKSGMTSRRGGSRTALTGDSLSRFGTLPFPGRYSPVSRIMSHGKWPPGSDFRMSISSWPT